MANPDSNNKDQNPPSENEVSSMCDLMKNNTSTIINKLESQIPLYIQLYSDYYKEYLHSLDDIFGSCYIAEKEIFDRFCISPKSLKTMDAYWSFWTKILTTQIENLNNFQRPYIQMQISTMNSIDNYVHVMMDNYARVFSNLSSFLKK